MNYYLMGIVVFMSFVSGSAFAYEPGKHLGPAPRPQQDSDSTTQVARVGQTHVEPPKFTEKVRPQYPEAAADSRLQGYVILEAIFRKDGTIDDIQIVRGLGRGKYGFEDAAIEALRLWKFQPGEVAGIPADVRMLIKMDFIE